MAAVNVVSDLDDLTGKKGDCEQSMWRAKRASAEEASSLGLDKFSVR